LKFVWKYWESFVRFVSIKWAGTCREKWSGVWGRLRGDLGSEEEDPLKITQRWFRTHELEEEKFPGLTTQASGSSGRLSPIIVTEPRWDWLVLGTLVGLLVSFARSEESKAMPNLLLGVGENEGAMGEWGREGREWAYEVDIVRVHLSIETRCIHSKGRVEGGRWRERTSEAQVRSERQDKKDKTRQDKTRQDKTRQDKIRQGRWKRRDLDTEVIDTSSSSNRKELIIWERLLFVT
jgi:hypothetical protein